VRILLYCTDRGTHGERRLAWLLAELEAGERVMALVPWIHPNRLRRDEAARPVQRGTLRIPRCPTCPRDVQMGQENALRRYDALIAAGLDTLDISSIR